jgi:hypothetical protein
MTTFKSDDSFPFKKQKLQKDGETSKIAKISPIQRGPLLEVRIIHMEFGPSKDGSNCQVCNEQGKKLDCGCISCFNCFFGGIDDKISGIFVVSCPRCACFQRDLQGPEQGKQDFDYEKLFFSFKIKSWEDLVDLQFGTCLDEKVKFLVRKEVKCDLKSAFVDGFIILGMKLLYNCSFKNSYTHNIKTNKSLSEVIQEADNYMKKTQVKESVKRFEIIENVAMNMLVSFMSLPGHIVDEAIFVAIDRKKEIFKSTDLVEKLVRLWW